MSQPRVLKLFQHKRLLLCDSRTQTRGLRMTLLLRALAPLLLWADPPLMLRWVGTGLLALLVGWAARLLLRHAWFTRRMSRFSRPRTRSWLLGHLGQVRRGGGGARAERTERSAQTVVCRCRAARKASSAWTSWCRPTDTAAAGSSARSTTWSESSTPTTSNRC